MLSYLKFFLLIIFIVFSGCATIFKGPQSNVYFLNGPDDLEIFNENGEKLYLEMKKADELYSFSDSFKDEIGNTKTTYYAYGYKFPDGSKKYNLLLKSKSSGDAEVKLEPKMAMRWFWLDLFIGGWIVDMITGNWNELAPVGGEINQVDVSKYLE